MLFASKLKANLFIQPWNYLLLWPTVCWATVFCPNTLDILDVERQITARLQNVRCVFQVMRSLKAWTIKIWWIACFICSNSSSCVRSKAAEDAGGLKLRWSLISGQKVSEQQIKRLCSRWPQRDLAIKMKWREEPVPWLLVGHELEKKESLAPKIEQEVNVFACRLKKLFLVKDTIHFRKSTQTQHRNLKFTHKV